MRKKPFILQIIFAVSACKLTRFALRVMHRGGTALPGRVAMAFCKNILEVTSEGMEILVVTGTNGKTTTARMLEHAMTEAGRHTLANRSGANLLSGVTAEFTADATVFGHPHKKYAVIECDEGALKQVVPLLHPRVIVVTNLFRDQLDRYGEVMHTLEAIKEGVRKVPESVLCLNADDSLTSSLALDAPNPVTYFGLDVPVGSEKDAELSDARCCIRCGTEYQYRYHTYAHLGGFFCPKCGYQRPDPDVSVTKIGGMDTSGTEVRMKFGGKNSMEEKTVRIGLPAVYNVYNAAAAAAAYRAAGYPVEEVLSALKTVHSSFGRMETFVLGETKVQMILVKNPAGFNQAAAYLCSLDQDFRLILCLNDRTADGHDISWIWDAEYEKLCENPHLKEVLTSGDRAEDLNVRLKYGGLSEKKMRIVRDGDQLLREMAESTLPVFVLPNYTTMLALRAKLGEATGKHEFWEG